MRALILAAGKGTRLGALTANCPKPLLDLGGKPILENIMLPIRDAGVSEFVIITGYLAEQIENHLGDGERLGVSVKYIRQDNPQGTGEAVHLARELLSGEPFLMTYGDIVISPQNCGGILREFTGHASDLVMGLNWMDDPAAGGAVYVDESNRVTRMEEKPAPGTSTTNWNSAGLMVFNPVVFEHTAALKPSKRGEYELTDAIVSMLTAGLVVRGYPLEGYWSDVGTPEDLERTREAWTR